MKLIVSLNVPEGILAFVPRLINGLPMPRSPFNVLFYVTIVANNQEIKYFFLI